MIDDDSFSRFLEVDWRDYKKVPRSEEDSFWFLNFNGFAGRAKPIII
jgi:hypothetical protein